MILTTQPIQHHSSLHHHHRHTTETQPATTTRNGSGLVHTKTSVCASHCFVTVFAFYRHILFWRMVFPFGNFRPSCPALLVCIHTLAGQKLCMLSLHTANPFPLESFCQHDSGQFPPQKSFLVYQIQNVVIIDRATVPHLPHKMDMINRSGTDSKS